MRLESFMNSRKTAVKLNERIKGLPTGELISARAQRLGGIPQTRTEEGEISIELGDDNGDLKYEPIKRKRTSEEGATSASRPTEKTDKAREVLKKVNFNEMRPDIREKVQSLTSRFADVIRTEKGLN